MSDRLESTIAALRSGASKIVLALQELEKGLAAIPGPGVEPTPQPPPPPPPPPPPSPNSKNEIALTADPGVVAINWPFVFGRPFVEGEIANYPKPLVNGVAVPYRCTILQRYNGASAKHARIQLVVPSFPAKITFANTTVTPALVDTTVPAGVALDAAAPTKAFFHAVRWPELGGLTLCRIGGENIDTETMQDVNSKVVMRNGSAVLYEQANVNIHAASRFSRQFWIGGAAPEHRINVEHNVGYLAATRFIEPIDQAIKPLIPRTRAETNGAIFNIADYYAGWQAKPKALYDAGIWGKYLPTGGGGNHIGPYVMDAVRLLATGDWRMFEIVSRSADLAGAWPWHCREGSSARKYDKAQTISAFGKPISVYARPRVAFGGYIVGNTGSPDDVTIHAPRILPQWNGWVPDEGHEPDAFSVIYTITGDPYYLEELHHWAAVQVVATSPDYKGPAPSGGLFSDGQLRARAWALRARMHAAFLSVDGTPEKVYFTEMMDHAFAWLEGLCKITGAYDGHPIKEWAKTAFFAIPANPMHAMDYRPIGPAKDANGNTTTPYMGVISAQTASVASAGWTQYFMIMVLGMAKSRGFKAGPLLSYAGEYLTMQVSEPGYDRKNIVNYAQAVADRAGVPFPTFAAALPSFIGQYREYSDAELGVTYAAYAYAASTFLLDEPGGKAAYEYIRNRWYKPAFYALNPNCAFVPL